MTRLFPGRKGVFSRLLFLCCLTFLFLPSPSHADVDPRASLTFYVGQGVDSNLIDVLPDLVQGETDLENSYLFALGYAHPLPTPDAVQKIFDVLRVPGTHMGLEGIVAKHQGLQHNGEVDADFFLKFNGWGGSFLRVRPALGIGFSYALGNPSYEDGPEDDPEKRYRFQNYNFYELEWSAPRWASAALVTRIHHRSGIYGLIAPRHVGSNFLTLGLRYGF